MKKRRLFKKNNKIRSKNFKKARLNIIARFIFR